MATTLGLHAPRLETVRDLRTKRGRRDAGRFFVEGPTLLGEALAAGIQPEALYVTEGNGAEHLRAVGNPYDDRTFVVPERAMARLSDLESPPGLIAVFASAFTDLPTMLADGQPVAVLAGVADPGNAGTLLRTAEIFGIERAVFVGEAVEPHNPKVVRATMGAIFRVQLAIAEPRAVVAAAHAANYTIVGAGREGLPLPGYRFPRPAMLAIGNERHGVAHALPACDQFVAVPHRGQGESLNAAVAGGIIFYTFSQQVADTLSEDSIVKKP